LASDPRDPGADRSDRELGGVVGDADADPAGDARAFTRNSIRLFLRVALPKIRDEIFEDAAALGGKGFSARFGQYNGWLVSRQPALRAIFCLSAGIFEGFRHRYAGGGSSFGFPRARPAPGITTSPEWRLLPA
jgi:hypothetical protein